MTVSAIVAAVVAASSWQLVGPVIKPAKPTWEERFEDPSFAFWEQVHRATASRLALVDEPTRDGGRAARFSAADGDVAPLTPTANPRAQLNSKLDFAEGDNDYVGWSTYLPKGFPTGVNPWFVFFQFHGDPYAGSPRLALGVKGGRIGLERDAAYRFDRPWTAPVRTGRWMDFVMHVKWSRNPRVGFIELWLDGKKQSFARSGKRLEMATIKADQKRVEIIPTNYRKRGSVRGTVTVYHDNIAVGTSYKAVDR